MWEDGSGERVREDGKGEWWWPWETGQLRPGPSLSPGDRPAPAAPAPLRSESRNPSCPPAEAASPGMTDASSWQLLCLTHFGSFPRSPLMLPALPSGDLRAAFSLTRSPSSLLPPADTPGQDCTS